MKLELFKNCIPVYVYRSSLGDCTNNGISKHSDTLIFPLIPTSEIDTSNLIDNCLNGVPVVEMVKRNIGGEYLHLKPLGLKKHSMMGGNFAYSCDSRFTYFAKYPLPIHDRIE